MTRSFAEIMALHERPDHHLSQRDVEALATYATQFKDKRDEHVQSLVRAIDRLTDQVVDAEGVLRLLVQNQILTGVVNGQIVLSGDEYVEATDEQRALVTRLLEEAA